MQSLDRIKVQFASADERKTQHRDSGVDRVYLSLNDLPVLSRQYAYELYLIFLFILTLLFGDTSCCITCI